MFKELLQEVVDGTEGAVAGLVMGFDGIAVETYTANDEVPTETIGMEYSVVLGQVRQAAEMLELGETREVSVRAESMTTVMRLLNEEYFVAVALLPHGNPGKARFALRMRSAELVTALS